MRPPIAALLALSVLIATSALVVALVEGDPAPVPDSTIEERLDRLELAVAALQQQSASESRPSASSGDAPSRSRDTLDDRLRALEEMFDSSPRPSGRAAGEEMELSAREIERTRRALDQIRREEMGDQVTRWVEKERKQSKELISALDKRLELASHERAALERVFEDEGDAHGALLEELWDAEAAGSSAEQNMSDYWDHAVVRMKELRLERERKLKEILGSERYAQYQRLAGKPRASRPSNPRE